MPRPPTITPDGVVEAIQDADTPFLSTGDLADHFDVTRQAVRGKRERLAGDPRINVGKVGNSTVFYLSESPPAQPVQSPGERRLEPDQGVKDDSRTSDPDEDVGIHTTDGGEVDTKNLLEKLGSLKAITLYTAVFAVGLLLFELSYILFQAGGTTFVVLTAASGTVAIIAATVGVVLATLAQLALGWPIASHVPYLGRHPTEGDR